MTAPASPDPRIRSLAVARTAARAEKDRLDRVVAAYAAQAPGPCAYPAVDFIRHHAFTDSTPCGCRICAAWWHGQGEMARALAFVPPGHKWSTCACRDCRLAGRLGFNLAAAGGLRDLLIEMSYHARFNSRFGDRVMQWFDEETRKPTYTLEWCACWIPRKPVRAWLDACDRELRPVTGAPVFRETEPLLTA